MEVHFCIQDPTHPETTYLYEAIIAAAVGAAAWRGIYAFASRDGVDHLIEDPVVHDFMRASGETDLLVGIDAVTNRPTLERLRDLGRRNAQFRPRVFWNGTHGLFHPKLSDFRYGDGRRTLIVGSGNLTPGGLMNNFEGYTIISEFIYLTNHTKAFYTCRSSGGRIEKIWQPVPQENIFAKASV